MTSHGVHSRLLNSILSAAGKDSRLATNWIQDKEFSIDTDIFLKRFVTKTLVKDKPKNINVDLQSFFSVQKNVVIIRQIKNLICPLVFFVFVRKCIFGSNNWYTLDLILE